MIRLLVTSNSVTTDSHLIWRGRVWQCLFLSESGLTNYLEQYVYFYSPSYNVHELWGSRSPCKNLSPHWRTFMSVSWGGFLLRHTKSFQRWWPSVHSDHQAWQLSTMPPTWDTDHGMTWKQGFVTRLKFSPVGVRRTVRSVLVPFNQLIALFQEDWTFLLT